MTRSRYNINFSFLSLTECLILVLNQFLLHYYTSYDYSFLLEKLVPYDLNFSIKVNKFLYCRQLTLTYKLLYRNLNFQV